MLDGGRRLGLALADAVAGKLDQPHLEPVRGGRHPRRERHGHVRHAVQHEAGWSDGDVAEATAKLRDKGWLDKQGRATDICHEGRKQIEELTDQMNAHHWMEIGAETSRELSSLLTVINKQSFAKGKTQNGSGCRGRLPVD